MNKKLSIFFLTLLALPSCIRNFKRPNIPLQQQCLSKKAYLTIDDIECEDCFKLIQGVLMPIKGVRKIELEKENNDYQIAGSSSNRVVLSYDPMINLNTTQVRMILEEWTFELQKIEL